MKRTVIVCLIVMLAILQARLWGGQGSLTERRHLSRAVAEQGRENERLRERNAALVAEIRDLKEGTDAIEERVRYELTMTRTDETFFQIVDSEQLP